MAVGFLRRDGTPDMARRCQNARSGRCQLQGASIEPDSSVCHQVTLTHWLRQKNKGKEPLQLTKLYSSPFTIYNKNWSIVRKQNELVREQSLIVTLFCIFCHNPKPSSRVWLSISACLEIPLMQLILPIQAAAAATNSFLHWLYGWSRLWNIFPEKKKKSPSDNYYIFHIGPKSGRQSCCLCSC